MGYLDKDKQDELNKATRQRDWIVAEQSEKL